MILFHNIGIIILFMFKYGMTRILDHRVSCLKRHWILVANNKLMMIYRSALYYYFNRATQGFNARRSSGMEEREMDTHEPSILF
jgi:hypothetical protein